eukprot:6308942-Alexandrium_andersonii.AAC.1
MALAPSDRWAPRSLTCMVTGMTAPRGRHLVCRSLPRRGADEARVTDFVGLTLPPMSARNLATQLTVSMC